MRREIANRGAFLCLGRIDTVNAQYLHRLFAKASNHPIHLFPHGKGRLNQI
jgi:hypothetical protein